MVCGEEFAAFSGEVGDREVRVRVRVRRSSSVGPRIVMSASRKQMQSQPVRWGEKTCRFFHVCAKREATPEFALIFGGWFRGGLCWSVWLLARELGCRGRGDRWP